MILLPARNTVRYHLSMQAKAIVLAGSLLSMTSAQADRIDDFVTAEIRRKQIQGIAVGVIYRGKEVKAGEYGIANLEHKVPITRDTVFEIGSVTTQFTAAGILVLMQDGRLSLDDRISKYIRDTPPAWGPITIRHLLNHSSGLKSFTPPGTGFELTRRLTQAQFLEAVGAWPSEFAPGEKYNYSTTGYSLLGYIIENVSGKTFWQFLSERVFQPLEMTESGDRDPRRVIPNRADGYEITKAGEILNRDYDLTDMFAAGAMATSLRDMFKWDAALNGEKILSAATKQEMWTPARLNNGQKSIYALGCRVDRNGVFTLLAYTGSTSGFSSCYLRIPEVGLGIIVMANTSEVGLAYNISKTIAGFYLEQK